jgi:colanic acid/amylovoran biosynthesis glycosyltransferase
MSEPLRVAYLTTRYPGVSHTFILREVEALRERGVEVETYSVRGPRPEDLRTDANREAARTTFVFLPPRVGAYLRAHAAAARRRPLAYLRTLAAARRYGEPGLRGRLLPLLWALEAVVLWHRCEASGSRHVHVHFAGAPPVIAGLAVEFGSAGRRPSGCRSWSATIHGPVEFFDQRLAIKLAGAARIVCISDYARSQLMSLLDEADWGKLLTVYCGLDAAGFRAKMGSDGSRRDGTVGAAAAPLRLLNVGRLVSLKGHAVLLEALARLTDAGLDVRLTVIGDGPKRAALEREAASRGLADRVEWTGALGQDEVPARYAESDVFCLPSFAEGLPTVLMEAMLTELPVVSTRIAAVQELVEDGVSGLVVAPGRADALARAIERLAADPALRRRMGRAGRAKVEAEFDSATSATQLAAAFAAQIGA